MDFSITAIVGPTAAGKTTWALQLAREQNGEIISVDSRQVYRELTVGTAKPPGTWTSVYAVEGIPYHLVDFLDPRDAFSAAAFARRSDETIQDILRRGKKPILAGGTGFYLKALRDGLAPMPPADDALRKKLFTLSQEKGRLFLHQQLAAVDPEAAQKIPFNNIHRVIRALEVYRLSGQPLSVWHAEHQQHLRDHPGKYRFRILGLDPGMAELARRIETRCKAMLEQGMIEETQGLLKRGAAENCPGLSGLGYPRVVSYLKGLMTKTELLRLLIQDTRQYAKRQRTWFKTQLEVAWKES
jgi:tRNA dimethylallyltransferase